MTLKGVICHTWHKGKMLGEGREWETSVSKSFVVTPLKYLYN